MKKQALLILAAGMLLSACGGGGTSASTTPAPSEPTSETSKPESAESGAKSETTGEESGETSQTTETSETTESTETSSEGPDEKADLAAFFANIAETRAFTFVDRGWRTIYGYGDDVFFADYDADYDEYDYGYLSHPTEGILGFVFDEDGKVAPNEVVDAECSYGDSVYDYDYTVMDIQGAADVEDWDVDEDGVFTTEDEDMFGLAACLADYGWTYADAVTAVALVVYDEGESADLMVDMPEVGEPMVFEITVGAPTEGAAAVEEWRADPWGMPEAPETDGRLDAFLENLATQKNFTMVDPDFRTMYGYGDDAMYNECIEEYADESGGILSHPTEGILGFVFDEDGKVAPNELISATGVGRSVYDYDYTPMDLTMWDAEEFTVTAVDTFKLTDANAKTVASYLAGYGSSLVNYVTSLDLVVDEDAEAATIVVETAVIGNLEFDLTIGTAQSEAIDEWRADPWGIPEPEADDPLYLFYQNLGTYRNFTMDDGDWRTMYGYCDEALYNDYYDGDDFGYVIVPETEGDLCKFTFGEEGEVVVDETPTATGVESVYAKLNSPMMFLDYTSCASWSAAEETGVYTSTNGYVAQIVTILAGYNSSYYSYLQDIAIEVDEDGMHAEITANLAGQYDVYLDITIGNAQNDAIDAYLGR